MKLVNIYPQYPITTVNPPIRTMVRRVHMPAANIRLCLLAKAMVEEILPDGSLVRLTLANYDTDNAPAKKVPVVHDVEVDPIKENAIIDPVVLNAPRNNNGKVDTSGMTKKQRRDYYRAKREAEAATKAAEEKASQVQPEKEPVVETASKEETTEEANTLDNSNFEVVDIETLGLH